MNEDNGKVVTNEEKAEEKVEGELEEQAEE